MNMKLYVTKDNENVINKTMVLKHETTIKLKGNTNISSPMIILTGIVDVDLLNCNYCYLSDFDRYYFIRDIEIDGGLYRFF